MEDWKQFELYALNRHLELYENHIAWHGPIIPEYELYEAGVIHDFNIHRMNRIRMKNEGTPFHYRDYGMDFMVKTSEGIYHACQVKHYTTRKVSANDLGTFFAVLFGQIKNTGYLYTSGPIEINLKECILNSDGKVIHHMIPFNKPEPAINITAETLLPLRPYQEEAIAALSIPGKNILNMACGLGKTLILGHILKSINPNRIICIAPLRVSVQNLHDRICPFLPNHRYLLVDSDVGGTTDLEIIKKALDDPAPLIIFSTFDSFMNIIHNITTRNEYLAIDEVHNIFQRELLCEAIGLYSNSLSISATIPEKLYDKIDFDNVYKYTVAQAISNKYICDYEIILPYLTTKDDGTTYVDVNIPAEINIENTNELVSKALFLVTGLFLYGSRRCVAYLPSCDDCDKFMVALQQVMERYHGSSLWCKIITHNTSAKKRNKILNIFQNDEKYDKYIILNVRILDEAVDIPKCDSEFIANIGEWSSDIRTVQRLMRGARLDSENPNKKNHIFLWTNEWSRIVNALSLLKEEDPKFNAKFRTINPNYEYTGNKIEKEKNQIQIGELSKYIEVKCMTLDEKWEIRRQEWIACYKRLGYTPKHVYDKDPEQHKAAKWQKYIRKAAKGKGSYKLSDKQKEILNNTEGWSWKENAFEEGLEKWKFQYNKLGHSPKQVYDKDPEQHKVAGWQNNIRLAAKGKGSCKLSDDQKEILNNTEGWSWKEQDSFEESLENWKFQYNKLGYPPKQVKNKDLEQYKAAMWQSNIRQAAKGKGSYKLSDDQKEILNNTDGWAWSSKLPKK